MGAKSFDGAALAQFLKSHESDYLYLVGDIIDGWKLNKRWYWTYECTQIIDLILQKAQRGTIITYLPGNHDDEIRRILPLFKARFYRESGIHIRNKIIHITSRGTRFLVLHGDQFDRSILRGRLSRWSDSLYDLVLDLLGSHGTTRVTKTGKIKPFSLAKSLRKQGQKALKILNNFEAAVYNRIQKDRLDGLICGHTHIPVIKLIRNVTYANCGGWLRTGHTALVETHEGNLRLIDWPSSIEHPDFFQAALLPERPASKMALAIVKNIKTLWPESRMNKKNKPTPKDIHLISNKNTIITIPKTSG